MFRRIQITYHLGSPFETLQRHRFTVKRSGGEVDFITTNGADWSAEKDGRPITSTVLYLALGFRRVEDVQPVLEDLHVRFNKATAGRVGA